MKLSDTARLKLNSIGWVCIFAWLVFWLLGFVLSIFGEVWPYMHTSTYALRVGILASIGLLGYGFTQIDRPLDAKPLFRGTRKKIDWKGHLCVLILIACCTLLSATFTPNMAGLIVLGLPNASTQHELTVIEVSRSKSSKNASSRTRLTLGSIDDSQSQQYHLVLSHDLFGGVPPMKAGDRVRVFADENQFGRVVNAVEVLNTGQSVRIKW
jgi:hypothetical protein